MALKNICLLITYCKPRFEFSANPLPAPFTTAEAIKHFCYRPLLLYVEKVPWLYNAVAIFFPKMRKMQQMFRQTKEIFMGAQMLPPLRRKEKPPPLSLYLSLHHFLIRPKFIFFIILEMPHNSKLSPKSWPPPSPDPEEAPHYLEDWKFMGNLFRGLLLVHDEGKTKTQCCESIDGSRPCEVLITWFRFSIKNIFKKT